MLHPTILREYDIRGIIDETLNSEDAMLIARGLAVEIQRKGYQSLVCIGYDGRLSSPALEEAMVEGFVSSGMTVKRIGLVPTPALYYAALKEKAGGAVMITGSHNPPTHNGFKLMLGAKALYGQGIKDIGAIIEQGSFIAGRGSFETINIEKRYLENLIHTYQQFATPSKSLRVAWDSGNGATGRVVELLTKQLPGEHILLNTTIDGTFPNHHPDPSVEKNLKELQAEVIAHQCDLGIAFDGDGDRIGVVDNQGHMIFGDQLMILLARDVLTRHPGSTIIADVKASQALFDDITAHGGNALMWKTGHSLIKAKLAEVKAPLAGEMSGHIFFADSYEGFDDAIYAAIRLLCILTHQSETLSASVSSFPKMVNTPELRFDCPDTEKFKIIETIKTKLLEDKIFTVNTIDGVRVVSPQGWWLLRASNTQAALVARCEAKNQKDLDMLKAQLADALILCGLCLPET